MPNNKILIADDEPYILRSLSFVLKKEGFDIETACNGEEALEKALRIFKKKLDREGTLKEMRAKKHYEKPSEKKKRKAKNARSGRR